MQSKDRKLDSLLLCVLKLKRHDRRASWKWCEQMRQETSCGAQQHQPEDDPSRGRHLRPHVPVQQLSRQTGNLESHPAKLERLLPKVRLAGSS